MPIPHFNWEHTGPFAAFDTAAYVLFGRLPWLQSHWCLLHSVRRGFEVYRQVCSTCHSLEYISYRNLVGVSHTKEQAEALAKSIEVQDGPDDKGEMFKRPGTLTDKLPNPYPNAAFARYANGGALPPDLSLIVKVSRFATRFEQSSILVSQARPGATDYIFALLTGYRDAPAGACVRAPAWCGSRSFTALVLGVVWEQASKCARACTTTRTSPAV